MVIESSVLQDFVDGRFTVHEVAESVPTVNPTRPNDVIARVPCGSRESVNLAVQAAAEAAGSWRRLTGPERADHLYRWADAFQAQAEDLAIAIVREVGKPIGEAKGEVARCVMILRYFAGEAVREEGSVIPSQAGNSLQYSI